MHLHFGQRPISDAYQTVAGSKHGELSCSHGTFLQTALYVAPCLHPPFHSLHITGPSQCPRVEKPHPASVAGTRPAVAGCARKEVVQDRHYRKFSQDTFDGDDVENRFPVVELVYNPRNNTTQANLLFNNNSHNSYNMHNMYNCYNCYNYHSQDRRMIPTSIRAHNRRTWIQCQPQQMLRTGAKP
jgi:hypothetical protein